ncbi:hypothetical protein ACXO6N_001621 [Campylobacter upsaliensis]|nr:hypothetical protein [Campylobacter upsaliensis]EAI4101354.1 hypothetical protein [Campylobacter jejuni]EAH5676775.1 hypothetical protein [Campylobacter upsaliensis]EAH5886625.1 hypothetical protein [Campylobacter upsaliensis]EAI4357851.1 hypothetical protein [Campylobacter upsaliensis]EAI8232980.1 hypothetical protein [Campylobacter upsaliensis]
MKVDTNKIKGFCEKNKTMLILIGVLSIMLILASYLFLANNNNDLSESFETQNELNLSKQEDGFKMQNPFLNQNSNESPPPLNEEQSPQNPFNQAEQNISKPLIPPKLSSKENEAIVFESNESKIPDSAHNSFMKSTDTTKEIAKTQKPSDMVEFLHHIKDKIILKKQSFTFDGKEYEINDRFLDFYEIEDIKRNFIRFKDEDYSYNLRFIGVDDEW